MLTYCLHTLYIARVEWYLMPTQVDWELSQAFQLKEIRAAKGVSAFIILCEISSVTYILLTVYFASRLANDKFEEMKLNNLVSGAHAFGVAWSTAV